MRRVAIVGAGGAGKSWLALDLGERLGIDPIHLDALYYDRRWQPTAPQRWEELQRELVAADTWIIDGNYRSTMEIRLAAADTIVFLDVATPRRLRRVVARRLKRRGPARPNLVGAERLTWAFLRYIATYNRTRRPDLLRLLARHADHSALHVVRSDADVQAFLDRADQRPSARRLLLRPTPDRASTSS